MINIYIYFFPGVSGNLFKNYKFLKIFIFIAIINFFSADLFSAGPISTLTSLNLQSSVIKDLRKDIARTLSVTKGCLSPEKLPDLKFYQYKIKNGDSFWKILARTSLDIDTLSTVNSLSSPSDITPGKIIYIPNMRGIIYKKEEKDSLDYVSRKYNVDRVYVSKVNRLNECEKDYLFIPCGNISRLEKSLFLGAGFGMPVVTGHRTSAFGRRIDPFNRRFAFHQGVDISCRPGTSVHASRDGVVVYTGYKGGYGLLAVIKHEHGYYSHYGHLSKLTIKQGDSVKMGDVIALSGNSGRSTGPHLHFEVRRQGMPVNPGVLFK